MQYSAPGMANSSFLINMTLMEIGGLWWEFLFNFNFITQLIFHEVVRVSIWLLLSCVYWLICRKVPLPCKKKVNLFSFDSQEIFLACLTNSKYPLISACRKRAQLKATPFPEQCQYRSTIPAKQKSK